MTVSELQLLLDKYPRDMRVLHIDRDRSRDSNLVLADYAGPHRGTTNDLET